MSFEGAYLSFSSFRGCSTIECNVYPLSSSIIATLLLLTQKRQYATVKGMPGIHILFSCFVPINVAFLRKPNSPTQAVEEHVTISCKEKWPFTTYVAWELVRGLRKERNGKQANGVLQLYIIEVENEGVSRRNRSWRTC